MDTAASTTDRIQEWAPIVVGILGGVVGVLGLVFATYFNKQTLKQKQVEDLRKEIYKKLNSFYGPCLLLLRISSQYYEILRSDKAEDFGTLRFFLEGSRFDGNDAALYEKINSITNDIDELIKTNSGLVDSSELRSLLARASAHFGVIDLAYRGKLEGDPERLSAYSYPRTLMQEIEDEVVRLNNELDVLNGEVQVVRKPRRWFRVPADQ